ncbi:MAG: glycoside hydrolase family 3 N-terminal domain-containing protein [Anaerolineae bacterium]
MAATRLGAVLAALAVLALATRASVQAQGSVEESLVQGIISRMSVEEKVGQLFLVTFQGNDVGAASDIAGLIRDYKIGGVAISPANGNFRNEGDTPQQVAQLTNALQNLALQTNPANPVALFVAVEQTGDGYPYTTLRNNFTPLPSPMALGATWSDVSSMDVGRIVGQELAAVGVNMLMGPSLDVLAMPRPNQSGDLGVRAFGGDPQWVGRNGRAYIQGVHQGSVARVATVARHFPGIGASDRSSDDEVATVDRPEADLRRVDLAPFLQVTASAPNGATEITDALMSAHVRYGAWQRTPGQPISLDAQGGLQRLLDSPDMKAWRERGIMVSDALGAPAVRKLYDPKQETFNQKRIARDAFLAGNDVLYLARFSAHDQWSEQLANTRLAIEFFRDQYRTDPQFRERVDTSLRRILLLKRRMYSSFTASNLLVDDRRVGERVGRDERVVNNVARDAVTLVSPTRENAARVSRPVEGDRILVVTDGRAASDCAGCPAAPLIAPTAIQDIILRLYGPSGASIISPDRISSISFADLKAYLAGSGLTDEQRRDLEGRLQAANLLVFGMLDTAQDPSADALRMFLRDRSAVLGDKNVVVMAFGAPYYLDATEIGKLSAYFALYGKTQPFLEAGVRALFQEFVPRGAPPVSVPGIYDLPVMLEPDSSRPIPIGALNKTSGDKAQVGETVTARAGPILDRNGHPVPDGTRVNLQFFYRAAAVYLPNQEIGTRNGVAETTVFLERPGQLEISAAAGRTSTTTPFVLAVQGEGPVTAVPTPQPSATPQPTLTVTPSPTVTATPAAAAQAATPLATGGGWAGLALSLATVLGVGALGVAWQRGATLAPNDSVRLLLLATAWGLVGYLINVAGGSTLHAGALWIAPLVSGVFALLPALWLWLQKR